jgi:signal transduction histidine kinase
MVAASRWDAWNVAPDRSTRRLQRFFGALLLLQLVVMLPLATALLVQVGRPIAALPLAVVAVVTIGVVQARRLTAQGQPARAIVLLAVVFVPAAFVSAAVGEYALPVLAVATVIPPTLAVPFLPQRSTVRLLTGSVVFSALLTITALSAPSLGLADVPSWFETLNLLIGAPIACALVMQLAWQNHLGMREKESELRRASRELVATTDDERRRAERDLHDGAQQRLHAAIVQVALARRLLDRDLVAAQGVLDTARGEIDATVDELDRLARGLPPTILAEGGLAPALDDLAARSALVVRVKVVGVDRLSPTVESAIWFCCSEAVQNAAKHAGAGAAVTISVTHEGSVVRFEVTDDGSGFDPDAVPTDRGQGVANMRERLESIGGRLTIHSAPGAGTTTSGVVTASAESARIAE